MVSLMNHIATVPILIDSLVIISFIWYYLTLSDDHIWGLLLELLDEGDPDGRGGGQDVPHLTEEGGVGGRAGDQEAQQRRGHVQEVGLKSRETL